MYIVFITITVLLHLTIHETGAVDDDSVAPTAGKVLTHHTTILWSWPCHVGM